MKKIVLHISIISLLSLFSCQSKVDKRVQEEHEESDSLLIDEDTLVVEPQPVEKDVIPKKTVQKVDISKTAASYSLRKYNNVRNFYSGISAKATVLCMENNIPPAALLAIAGLESGWNQGYIGRISGNILSLGTRRGDTELPALRLPRLKSTGKILFDSLEIIKYAEADLIWEDRPSSLKKDYRPAPYAGTSHNLAYFKYHPEEKEKAHLSNLSDFVSVFIARKSRIRVYRKARKLMDDLVEEQGKEVLLKEETAIQFVNAIGGKPNSFNFRETWPVKVITIIKKVNLAELTTELYTTDKTFEEVWEK